MAYWDTSMPLDTTDGQIIDEGDLDPLFRNVNSLRYATVFLGGQRRTTAHTGIGATEVQVLQTPSATLEAGALHKVEGLLKHTAQNIGGLPTGEVRLHEGSSVSGAVLLSYRIDNPSAGNGRTSAFSIYVKTLSTVSQRFTLGLRVDNGVGNLQVDVSSWIACLRSGDNSLMTEV